MEIDLNADLGEGAGFDAELMPLVTSANVCCGLHAGEPGRDRARRSSWPTSTASPSAPTPATPTASTSAAGNSTSATSELVALCVYQLGGARRAGRGRRT